LTVAAVIAINPSRRDFIIGGTAVIAATGASSLTAGALGEGNLEYRNATELLAGLAERLDRSGTVIARATPLLPDLAETTRIYVELLTAFSAADLPPDAYQRAAVTAQSLPPDASSVAAFLMRGRVLSHRDWLLASRRRNALRQQWRDLFREFDVVLCPAMPTPAFPHDHSPIEERRLDIDGKPIPYEDQFAWASIATLTGLPATVAPIGLSETGLPIGVQILGPYLEDRTTIAFAGLIEREFGGFVPPPSPT
jgi:amidase